MSISFQKSVPKLPRETINGDRMSRMKCYGILKGQAEEMVNL